MSVFLINKTYHYNFQLNGRRYKASTKKGSRQAAEAVERTMRLRLENGWDDVNKKEAREAARRTVAEAAAEFLVEYKAKHRAPTFAVYALGHVTRLVGTRMISEITISGIRRYQTDRLGESAAPKTINDEVQLLVRLCGDQGDLMRQKMKRQKSLKLKLPQSCGKAFTAEEKTRMIEQARLHMTRSPNIFPALVVALNAGLRDKESRELRWEQIDLVDKKTLVVGKSKTDAGAGRIIPLNGALLDALSAHAAWYRRRFKEIRPEWYVFAFGQPRPSDPTRHATTFKTVWRTIRADAKVVGRWHDNRHTLVTELAESGAGDEVIMSIAGHVSRQMLSRYSHVRNEAKRKALEEIYTRQRAAEAATLKKQDPLAQAQLDGGTRAIVTPAVAVQ